MTKRDATIPPGVAHSVAQIKFWLPAHPRRSDAHPEEKTEPRCRLVMHPDGASEAPEHTFRNLCLLMCWLLAT